MLGPGRGKASSGSSHAGTGAYDDAHGIHGILYASRFSGGVARLVVER
ncbi:MAG TPA: hypothetical protein VFV94_16025 [Polyangiaceae bacterium]|nr:hypothetical protein [Polyangiaceae bacterium]